MRDVGPEDLSFGKLLREYRVAAGLTREALAERAAMSARGVGALERGESRVPRFVTVRLLVQGLRLSPSQRARLEAAARAARLRERRTANDAHDVLPRTNLPSFLTSFHGRDQELERLCRLFAQRRLVTLWGPGGIGKTRLAIETARTIAQVEHERFRDGVWLVELGALTEPALVVPEIARVLQIEADASTPLLDVVTAALRPRRLLVVLDNCEHMLDAVAAVANHLVSRCPRVHVVNTSREPLRLPGERVERVGSLSESAATRLFLDRAADIAPEVALSCEDVASRQALITIVRRLDGVPLPIELAAARMSCFTLPALAQRLDDRFHLLTARDRSALPRHQSLRATLEWSYALLPERERLVFQRLAIFPRAWTLDTAQRICSDEKITADRLTDALSSLVDKSFVLAETEEGEPRYRLSETMRAYALERLEPSSSASTLTPPA